MIVSGAFLLLQSARSMRESSPSIPMSTKPLLAGREAGCVDVDSVDAHSTFHHIVAVLVGLRLGAMNGGSSGRQIASSAPRSRPCGSTRPSASKYQ